MSADEARGDADSPTEESDESPERIARRKALATAASAAAAAGAVWAAPAVEGLGIVPNYAAAATATTGSVQFSIGTSGSEANLGSGCNPGNHWFAVTSPTAVSAVRGTPYPLTYTNTNVTVSGGGTTETWDNNNAYGDNDRNTNQYRRGAVPGPTSKPASWPLETSTPLYFAKNAGFSMTAPLGTGVGNVTLETIPTAGSDLDAAQTWNVQFQVDPPFNKCRIATAVLHTCIIDSNGANSNQYLNSYNNATNNQATVPLPITNPGYNPAGGGSNPTGSWTSTITIPALGASNDYVARAVFFTVTCV